jgi:hypothetical protein
MISLTAPNEVKFRQSCCAAEKSVIVSGAEAGDSPSLR